MLIGLVLMVSALVILYRCARGKSRRQRMNELADTLLSIHDSLELQVRRLETLSGEIASDNEKCSSLQYRAGQLQDTVDSLEYRRDELDRENLSLARTHDELMRSNTDLTEKAARLRDAIVQDGQAVVELEQRIDTHQGADAALSTLTDPSLWAEHWASETLGPLDAGADSRQLSIHGLQQHGLTRPNWLVREGFGTVVASLAQGVPVALGERVREIDSRGPRVRVQTTGGTVEATDCIVTVSTGVLRAESMRFLPGLPLDTLRALEALPMGHFAKIILDFDAPLPGLPTSGWVMESQAPAGQTMHFLYHPFGSNLVVGLVGGAYGEALARLPEDLAVQEGLARLVQCVGPLPQRLVRGAFTNWAHDPLHWGGYAYLTPGGGAARQMLGTPVHERLYFAGEAVAQELAQTCGGAFLSGQQAADQILQRRS